MTHDFSITLVGDREYHDLQRTSEKNKLQIAPELHWPFKPEAVKSRKWKP